LLAQDLDGARDFVAYELGPLTSATSQMGTLRETLLRYLEEERSVTTVATSMHVARGTVAYRVRRAEELLGHDVGQRRFELHAALLLARRLGEAVLSPPSR
jgi:DNA-binding PucR family transcriptional regulator